MRTRAGLLELHHSTLKVFINWDESGERRLLSSSELGSTYAAVREQPTATLKKSELSATFHIHAKFIINIF